MDSPLLTAIKQYCKDEGITAYTTAQAAEKIGRPVDTVRRWRKRGVLVPSLCVAFGDLDVYLYSPDDIKRLRAYGKRTYPGRRTDLEE